ncbi:YrzE family protein [Pantoea sp. SoEX]|uniref:YrzE family protein n=1 Tax=Pantoea sp. SoEX TaxID=2576763 RepID=UPI00135CF551|nr:YrzE family protein [Pantoea sp. SoEX]MXP50828.1 hypothetical protein [Pantoea sp. SoEX]
MFDTKINNGNVEKVAVSERTSNLLHADYISWSAIFVGVIFTFILHILLTLLGTAITTTVIDIHQTQQSVNKLGNNSLIWIGATLLLSISIGSFVAGRLAKCSGALHGLLVFCLNTLITAWLAFSLGTNIFGNILNIAHSSLNKNIEENINVTSLPTTLFHSNKGKILDNSKIDNFTGNAYIEFAQTFNTDQRYFNYDFNKVMKKFHNKKLSYTNNDINILHINFVSWFKKVEDNPTKISPEDDKTKKISLVNNTKEQKKIVTNSSTSNSKKTDKDIDKTTKKIDKKNQDKKITQNTLSSNNSSDQIENLKKSTSKNTWYTLCLLITEALLSSAMGMLGYRSKQS